MSRSKRAGGNIPRGFIISLGISAAAIVLLSLVGAMVAVNLDDPTRYLGLISLCVMLLSAVACGIVSTIIKRDTAVRFCSLVALTMVLIMLLIDVIICKGRIAPSALMNYVCYFGVAVISSLLCKKATTKRRHR